MADVNVRRLPGLAFFYSELVQGIPPLFAHYVEHVPALHTILVFVSVKSLPISKVPPAERFLFRRAAPRGFFVFRCIARYGYKDLRDEREAFDEALVKTLKEFVKEETEEEERGEGSEVEVVEREWRDNGVVHLLGESEVVAGKGSGLLKRVVIDYAYNIMKRNLRQQDEVFTIPRSKLLKVGMTIEL